MRINLSCFLTKITDARPSYACYDLSVSRHIVRSIYPIGAKVCRIPFRLSELKALCTAQDGNTPAHRSAIRGYPGTLALLVQAKANLEATNAAGLTVLGAALTPGGAASAIQLLEAHGAAITDAVRDRLLAKGGCA